MRIIKNWLALIFAIAVGLAVVTILSVEGEREHQRRCAELGVVCDKGRMESLMESLEAWARDAIKPYLGG